MGVRCRPSNSKSSKNIDGYATSTRECNLATLEKNPMIPLPGCRDISWKESFTCRQSLACDILIAVAEIFTGRRASHEEDCCDGRKWQSVASSDPRSPGPWLRCVKC